MEINNGIMQEFRNYPHKKDKQNHNKNKLYPQSVQYYLQREQ